MLRTFAVTALLGGVLGGLLGLSGCGIEFPVLLNPPTAVSIGADQKFTFRATAENSEASFLGFEVYYKIYEAAVTPDISSIATFDDMIGAGFRRINGAGESPGSIVQPLIRPAAVDIGTTYQVTIDFSGFVVSTEYPRVTTDAATPRTYNQVRRGVQATISEYKKFIKAEFLPGDADISANLFTAIDQGNQIRILCFALSYGIDLSTGLALYSQPVALDDEIFQFPY